ncbi:MAG: peptide deformylase [Actinobacteria bacterium]|nr:peptide deformylase [Actinomycetota bacterium]
MAVREVLRYPNPVLKREARPLGSDESELALRVGQDLVDTMRSFPRCVGIAAPQLGELVRMIVVDVTDHPKATACHGELVLVNPRVVASSGSVVAREGCLSIPDLTANVRRATEVTVEAVDPEGRERSIDTEGFEARCLLHEIDHLDGILFLDRVDSLATDVFRRKSYG